MRELPSLVKGVRYCIHDAQKPRQLRYLIS
jgi:hypothetical protein